MEKNWLFKSVFALVAAKKVILEIMQDVARMEQTSIKNNRQSKRRVRARTKQIQNERNFGISNKTRIFGLEKSKVFDSIFSLSFVLIARTHTAQRVRRFKVPKPY